MTVFQPLTVAQARYGCRGWAVVKCKPANLQTGKRGNCRPKLADRQCGPVGNLWTTKMRTPCNQTPNERWKIL